MRLGALLVVCGVALSGCGSGPASPTPASCTFTLSATSITIAAAGGPGSITVSTGSQCSWTARSEASWISATGGTSVTGPGTFSFTVAAATGTAARTGALTVAGQSVQVSQPGQSCAFTLLPAGRSFDAPGGTGSFDVTTGPACGWTSATTAPWITIVSGRSGTGSGTVTYAAAPNPDASPRTANVTAGDGTHAVTQSGLTSCAVAIDPDDETFAVGGGSGRFNVSAASTCAWLAASGAAWIRVTDPAGGIGSGSRPVVFSVEANAAAASRTGTIAVGGQTFVATQAGTSTCTYAVTPVSVRACEIGGERTVAVDTAAGCGWSASTTASWIAISAGQTGLGPGTVRFTLQPNFNPARQDFVKVRWPAPTEGQNVWVDQEGCDYGIHPAGLTVLPACGGDFHLEVWSFSTDQDFCGFVGPTGRGRCEWSADSNALWLTVLTPMPRNGEDTITIHAAVNANASPRSANITVGYRTLTIVQQAGPCLRP